MRNALPEIPPEDFVKRLDEVAFYIAERGMPLLVRSHYVWMTRFVAATIRQDPTTRVSVPIFPTLPALRVKVRFPATPNATRFFTLLLAALQVQSSAAQFLSLLPNRLTWTAIRGLQRFAVLNLAAVPALVATIVIVFLTGDAWRILGRGFDLPLAVLVLVFFIVALLAVGDIRHLRRNIDLASGDIARFAMQTSAAPLLGPLVRRGRAVALQLSWIDTVNVWVIYVGMLLANLLVIAGLVTISLIVVGVIRIDRVATAGLLGHRPHVLVRLPIDHMVLTRELFTLSLSLGALATLSYAVASLQDADARRRFRRAAIEPLRHALAVYAVYLAARENADELTGVPADAA